MNRDMSLAPEGIVVWAVRKDDGSPVRVERDGDEFLSTAVFYTASDLAWWWPEGETE